MNLFVDYVQPLIDWLQTNPNWALFITFIISLAESLAIIGSLVPGSVTMTAIGILAGSGIMRIDLTLFAAILGAVAGDSLSYILGYFYSDQLTEMWPFRKYPKWIQYGKDFFATHGGKSVLIGRFVGPLRSIIPVIAGIMHMKHWSFFLANVLSAIGWSLLYVMPGVIIGTASHELSTQVATNLFILILIILAGLWLISLLINWVFKRLHSFLIKYLHELWNYLKTIPLLTFVYNFFTPKYEKNHYQTASLALIILLSILSFILLLVLTIKSNWLTLVNLPTNIFFNSFNTVLLKIFFIFCTQFTSTITILTFLIICICWFFYHKNFRITGYLFSLIIFSSLLAYILVHTIYSPRPTGILAPMSGPSFPAINLEIATSLYGFILFYITHSYSLSTNTIKTILLTILGLSGIGSIYLGDYWLTDIVASYFLGGTVCLIHCMIYRKMEFIKTKNSLLMIFPLVVGILLASFVSTYLNYQKILYNHTPYHKEFSLHEEIWWSQQKPVLPVYQLSRISKRISILNIQYAGDLNSFQEKLEQNGWITHIDSFFENLLTRMSKQSNSVKLPLLTQLYNNKPPVLMMTYIDKQSQLGLELRIWESNYNLIEFNKPLWIGSIHLSTPENKYTNNKNYLKITNPIPYMFQKDNSFVIKKIRIPDIMMNTTRYPAQPYLILIKEPTTSK